MPTIVITPNRGQARFLDVEDKAEAIRTIARSLKGHYTDEGIQYCLNEWLRGSMNTPLLLTDGNDKMQLKYIP